MKKLFKLKIEMINYKKKERKNVKNYNYSLRVSTDSRKKIFLLFLLENLRFENALKYNFGQVLKSILCGNLLIFF